jgi:hypothetical protein
VRRVGLPVTAQTHVNAAAQVEPNAAQGQPAQMATTTEVAAPAGAPIPGNEPGAIVCTLLSANAASRRQTPADNTASVTFDGHVFTCTVTKVKYSVNSDINFYTVTSMQFLAL